MFKYLAAFLIGYLFGSIPTAFILVKTFKKIDIRKVGSGNVGALNAYEVTGSALIGITVLVVDVLKGALAVKVCQSLLGNDSTLVLISGFSAVLGHNFSFWISFYGGRGLATSVGVFIVINPSVIFIWCVLWLIAYAKIRNVHAGNIWATIFTPLVILPVVKLFNSFSRLNLNDENFLVFVILISLLIFIKHLKPLAQLIKDWKVLKNKFRQSDV